MAFSLAPVDCLGAVSGASWALRSPSWGHLCGYEPAEKQAYEIRLFWEPLWHSLWGQLGSIGPSPVPLGRSEICLRAIFLATNLQKSRPQEPRDRREKAHHGLKMATKWVAQQSAACEAMRRITPCNPEWLQEAPKWPEEKRKIAPRWPQEHQDCRKKAQDGPKMATNWLAKPQERHRGPS